MKIISFKIIILFFFTLFSTTFEFDCGNGICSNDENKLNCNIDCDEANCRDMYNLTEIGCISNGWTKLYIDVNGIEREILWKSPSTSDLWVNGSIIWMHGGEGSDSNPCYAVPWIERPLLNEVFRGVPSEEFGNMAIEQGFAVFSLNSGYNRGVDENGLSIGKRWISLKMDMPNIDLDFIEKVVDEVIPEKRPVGSRKDIFMTGISNGGFMTTYVSTTFNEKKHLRAFAPVSSGDPYGTLFDMTVFSLRPCGPGTWLDLETGLKIDVNNSCFSSTYNNEREWPETKIKKTFKQFYHEDDSGVHFSCEDKTRELLVSHGYIDDGKYMIDGENNRNVEKHFWQREYNQPMLDFFVSQHSTDTNNYNVWIAAVSVSLSILFVICIAIVGGIVIFVCVKKKSNMKGYQLKDI